MIAAAVFAFVLVTDADAKCQTKRCELRVRVKLGRVELRYYKRHPMPRCTWWGESGAGLPEWSLRRYRARNPVSTAGGKYQILDSTWRAFGGPDYPGSHDASRGRPVLQERIARRVLRGQGLGAWVLC